jgi:hypothetical protein
LLVALIPGLLMLATLGLERLESRLTQDTVSATDVAEFLQQAKANEFNTLARDGMSQALDSLHRRLHDHDPAIGAFAGSLADADLPTRLYVQHRPNPQFQPTRHANRV